VSVAPYSEASLPVSRASGLSVRQLVRRPDASAGGWGLVEPAALSAFQRWARRRRASMILYVLTTVGLILAKFPSAPPMGRNRIRQRSPTGSVAE
jgi:hypothetical protein